MIAPEVKNALVVGGGSGMGRAAALALAAAGARVMVADLDLAAAQATASQAGGGSLGWAVDVADPASVAGLFAQLREEIEALHMLVHTAAILGGTAFIDEVSDAAWRRMMAVNLDGPFYCSREAVRWMKRTGGGASCCSPRWPRLPPPPGPCPTALPRAG